MSQSTHTDLRCNIVSLGAWGKDFCNWTELSELINTGTTNENTAIGPKPEVIPANERRRAPLPVRLAVESSWQACQASNYEPKELASVFVSGLGDTQLTDYMCKVLATEDKQLSPTKFHNSVHNAAAGYWTISTHCMKAANSVAGFDESVPLTLLEAISQCVNEHIPMLLTFYDAPASEVLKPLLENEQTFSVSMIIEPYAENSGKAELSVEILKEKCTWPSLNLTSNLQACYEQNPVAKILPLLEQLSGKNAQEDMYSTSTTLPLSTETSIKLCVRNANH